MKKNVVNTKTSQECSNSFRTHAGEQAEKSDARVEDGLAPDVAGIRVLGGVGRRVIAPKQRLALGGSGCGGVEQRCRGEAGFDLHRICEELEQCPSIQTRPNAHATRGVLFVGSRFGRQRALYRIVRLAASGMLSAALAL